MSSRAQRASSIMVLAVALCAATAGAAVSVTVDPGTKYQTMEGFGAFGGMNPYWTDLPYHNEAFLNLIVDTMGMTVNRMDLTAIENNPWGPRDWQVQVDFLKVLIAKHQASGEPFRLIASCWSPLAKWKTNGSINGGRLIMDSVAVVGEYLASFIPKIKNDIGVDLYALGPQNEPNLGTGYASCEYNPYEEGYLVQATAAAIKKAGITTTRVHFSDDSPWGGCWWPCLAYDSVLSKPAQATGFNSVLQRAGMTENVNDIANTVSLHYRNGNSEGSAVSSWGSYADLARRTGKQIWNTEFGNGDDTWEWAWTNTTDMYHMINFGFSMIVYWLYGPHSNPAQIGEGLLLSYKRGPKGFSAQAFSRYIRPGYVRVKATPTDAGMRTLAFTGEGEAATVLLINNSGSQQDVTVNGAGLPGGPYQLYRTGSGFNCVREADYTLGQSISIAPRQIVTLYHASTVPVKKPLPAASAMRPQGTAGYRIYGLNGALVVQGHGRGVYVRSSGTDASRAARTTVEFHAEGR